jgi:hypothetical protein
VLDKEIGEYEGLARLIVTGVQHGLATIGAVVKHALNAIYTAIASAVSTAYTSGKAASTATCPSRSAALDSGLCRDPAPDGAGGLQPLGQRPEDELFGRAPASPSFGASAAAWTPALQLDRARSRRSCRS